MNDSERLVSRLVAENWATTELPTPKEEIARQAVELGLDAGGAFEAIEQLRRIADMYEIRGGLLVPVEKHGFEPVVGR